jgi:hypothetical protein
MRSDQAVHGTSSECAAIHPRDWLITCRIARFLRPVVVRDVAVDHVQIYSFILAKPAKLEGIGSVLFEVFSHSHKLEYNPF